MGTAHHSAVNLSSMFSKFSEHWAPKKIAEINDYDVKIVKLQGDFTWHRHPDTDEFFLVTTWLARNGQSLRQCRQADVDNWLASGPGAGHARDFLTWAAARGHCPALDIPGPARSTGTAASQDERWAQAARLLHDTPSTHRPRRRMPAPALRPATVPDRSPDHQPGHQPRRHLTVARAWYHFKTDATGELSPAAEEAADLALWTGRLAYADPTWTLASGPVADRRPPLQLGGDASSFTRTVAAVHQAASTLTALAAADYTQIRTAALTGRLLVPAAQVPVLARNTERYARAPDRRASELLATYRDAGTASVKATTEIEAIITEHRARDRQPAASRSHRRVAGRVVPADAIVLSEPDPPAGAIERILADLGVTDAELLDRGVALDKAAAQLIAEAADRTAPQRWHQAVTRPVSGAVRNTTAVTRHVMAADQPAAAARLGPSMRALASRSPQAQPEPLQAEP
jgi:hypothetical protein